MEMKLADIKNILILGAGTMGLRIGLQAALSGFNVVIYDIQERSLTSAIRVQGAILQHLQKTGKITGDDAAEAVKRIRFTTDALEASKDADLVSESVFEDLKVKKEVWTNFAKLCPDKTGVHY
jgi:3-hydroxybutyryl-CoA dehydrogenase